MPKQQSINNNNHFVYPRISDCLDKVGQRAVKIIKEKHGLSLLVHAVVCARPTSFPGSLIFRRAQPLALQVLFLSTF